MKLTLMQSLILLEILEESLSIPGDNHFDNVFSLNSEERKKLHKEIIEAQKKQLDLPWK